MEKGEFFYVIGGNVNWYCHCEEQYGGSLKTLKVELPYDPEIPLLGIYSEKTIIHINTHMWNLEKWYRWTYFQGRNRDSNIENRHPTAGHWESESWGVRESSQRKNAQKTWTLGLALPPASFITSWENVSCDNYGAMVKNPPADAGDPRDLGSITGSGRFPAERNGNPSQYSCLENSTARGSWQITVHGITKSWTQLSD